MRLFFHLLINANFKDSRFKGVEVRRWQIVTWRKKLSEDLWISERWIRTAINHLKSTNELTSTTYRHFSIITITNYDRYQINDQLNDQQVTSKWPASDQLVTTIEEWKERKNDKNKEKNTKKRKFQEFWDLYPRKIWKKDCAKKYKYEEHDKIMQWLSSYILKWKLEWTKKWFIPHPSTWLNQERWSDEIEIESKAIDDVEYWKKHLQWEKLYDRVRKIAEEHKIDYLILKKITCNT